MFHSASARLLLLALLLLPLDAALLAQGTPEKLVLSNIALPPLSTDADDGYLDRLYPVWFERAGLRVELVSVPPARGLENANAGQYDGEAARLYLPPGRYPNLLRVPEPIFQVIFAGMHLKPDITVASAQALKDYRVGYIRGWQIAERLLADIDTAIAVRGADALLNMLRTDRLDIAMVSVAHARDLLDRYELERVHLTDFRIRFDMYLYVHARHADKVLRLTDTLRAMKADGTHAAIMADYDLEGRRFLSAGDAEQ